MDRWNEFRNRKANITSNYVLVKREIVRVQRFIAMVLAYKAVRVSHTNFMRAIQEEQAKKKKAFVYLRICMLWRK